jgi:hypothetical protein
VKPWEKALQREPLCAFVEAVVDGYSPIDKHLCTFARRAQWLRSQPAWLNWKDLSPGKRGDVWQLHDRYGWCVQWCNQTSGEIPWR